MTKKEIRLIKGIKSGNEKYLEKCIRPDVFVTLWKKRELLDESRSEKLQGC